MLTASHWRQLPPSLQAVVSSDLLLLLSPLRQALELIELVHLAGGGW
jgi:hypothetical protein